MIVSFEREFLFVAIPRTATHALREALRPHLGPRDWEQCTLFVDKRFPVAALAEHRHGHLSCTQVRPYLPAFVWDGLFKFCVVRNPYDRLVSCCSFLQRDREAMARDPRGTLQRTLRSDEQMSQVLLRPQSEFVVDNQGGLAVDFVVRYEHLQRDIDTICARLRIPPVILGKRNASMRPPALPLFDHDTRALTMARYRRDFELFEYPTEPLVSA
jgi:sulfotransferase famil protein